MTTTYWNKRRTFMILSGVILLVIILTLWIPYAKDLSKQRNKELDSLRIGSKGSMLDDLHKDMQKK